jgi:small subunit ribosomal protein S24e
VPRQRLSRPSLTLSSDVLHPNRPNVSKDELRQKLSELYKASKDQVSVFGFRTQFGGGKSTGFALIYESNEALKKFEPQYRLIRYEMAQRAERPSRAQRTAPPACDLHWLILFHRQAAKEQGKGTPRHGQGEGRQEEGEIDGFLLMGVDVVVLITGWLPANVHL